MIHVVAITNPTHSSCCRERTNFGDHIGNVVAAQKNGAAIQTSRAGFCAVASASVAMHAAAVSKNPRVRGVSCHSMHNSTSAMLVEPRMQPPTRTT